MVNVTLNRVILAILVMGSLFGVISCASPSKDGTQGHLKASIPIAGEWILE
jgi:hypothetical protein